MIHRIVVLGFFFVVLGGAVFFSTLSGDQATISPDIDVYIITFGGGEGLNTFIKYDISTVPLGMVIDSVFLRAYVWEVSGSWDGDVMFCNVNDQAWTEADSSRYIIDLPLSDSVLHASGFGISTGFAQSVDISSVFLTDYNASNTFCSVKLKDPDDVTFNPMPGSYPINAADTLGLGNTAMGFHIYFYPSEYVNAPPWLVVNYHATGVQEMPRNKPAEGICAYPNPFREKIEISFGGVSEYGSIGVSEMSIFDLSGRLVREFYFVSDNSPRTTKVQWDGRDDAGQRVAPGMYYVIADCCAPIRVVKLR